MQNLRDEYPFRDTPTALCLTAEIQRVSEEQGKQIADVVADLAKATGIRSSQIYNYRAGKTEIQPDKIRVFCEVLNSAALATAWTKTFQISHPERGEFDLARLAAKALRENLSFGEAFLGAFEDNDINGFEISDLRMRRTKAVSNFDRMMEAAETSYERKRAA